MKKTKFFALLVVAITAIAVITAAVQAQTNVDITANFGSELEVTAADAIINLGSLTVGTNGPTAVSSFDTGLANAVGFDNVISDQAAFDETAGVGDTGRIEVFSNAPFEISAQASIGGANTAGNVESFAMQVGDGEDLLNDGAGTLDWPSAYSALTTWNDANSAFDETVGSNGLLDTIVHGWDTPTLIGQSDEVGFSEVMQLWHNAQLEFYFSQVNPGATTITATFLFALL